jgi:hypothetical protein
MAYQAIFRDPLVELPVVRTHGNGLGACLGIGANFLADGCDVPQVLVQDGPRALSKAHRLGQVTIA